jgi:hypothetical protein
MLDEANFVAPDPFVVPAGLDSIPAVLPPPLFIAIAITTATTARESPRMRRLRVGRVFGRMEVDPSRYFVDGRSVTTADLASALF